MKHPAISQHVSEENLGPQTSAPQNSEYTVTSVLQSVRSDIRIGLIMNVWARGIGRTSGAAGWVNTLIPNCETFHHGCSFVFSFVAERSRAGSAS